MPVYNEEASIEQVVRDWFAELEHQVGDFLILAIDDGSLDGTLPTLRRLAEELGERLEVRSRPNRGHGQTCLEGYRIAAERGVPHILQIDSDGQCDPVFLREFWSLRGNHDVIYGRRRREDGFRRVVASKALRLLLRLLFRVDCIDANVPYRLMSTRTCLKSFNSIPQDLFLANVALAVLLRRRDDVNHGCVAIRFRERTGGEPSVPLSKFASKALEFVRQMKEIRD